MAWDRVYDKVTERFKKDAEFIVMDAGYKTAWIAKKVLEVNLTLYIISPQKASGAARLTSPNK